jgi:3'-phosphoadenosine 5'-phosphosulfate sulfotransferase (PAPS reductase)/FAD synthetase
MSDPFRITGPALVSFSGGLTSARMLRLILDAHGGTLPEDVHVPFVNTGKEREETLRFVHECATRWGVRVRWLEYRRRERGDDWEHGFTEVGYNSASRNGEPFAELIRVRGFPPNRGAGFCTIELKIRTMRNFARSLGWDRWDSIIGLRADEGMRVMRAVESCQGERWRNRMPLYEAGVTQRDVLEFWRAQDFDLGLKGYEGNCDLCFKKGIGKLRALVRENPKSADWWIEQEQLTGGTFWPDYSYKQLRDDVMAQGFLFDANEGSDPDDEHDAECGTWCGK